MRRWARDTSDAFGLDVTVKAPSPDRSSPMVDFRIDEQLPVGGYSILIDDAGIAVAAHDLSGAFSAAATLKQLAGPQSMRHASTGVVGVDFPFTAIVDHPRMQWRGVLLDVARHFMPKVGVLRFIDHAAAHKLNVIQLHLTDDQGWRVEIEAFPELTRVGAWRAESARGVWQAGDFDGQPHGGFYTQDDLREIVSYARARGITIVPEIDVPGHVEAAIAAYPHLGTTKTPREVRTTWGMSTQVLDPGPESLAFFRRVLDEVLAIFDSPWIALGGDEVPTKAWRESPEIIARATSLGLGDVDEMHGWFLAELCTHVISAGRRPMVWDEGFGPWLPREAIVTSWRGFAAGLDAMRAGHDVVMGPEQAVYLDHRAGPDPHEPVPVGFVRTVEDVYAFDPLPAALLEASPAPEHSIVPEGRLLGVQAAVWTEHLPTQRQVDYAAFPRLSAFAEVAWSRSADRSQEGPKSTEFLARLTRDHLPRLAAAGIEFRPLDGPHPWQKRPGIAGAPRDLAKEHAVAGWVGAGGWREGSIDPGELA